MQTVALAARPRLSQFRKMFGCDSLMGLIPSLHRFHFADIMSCGVEWLWWQERWTNRSVSGIILTFQPLQSVTTCRGIRG